LQSPLLPVDWFCCFSGLVVEMAEDEARALLDQTDIIEVYFAEDYLNF